MTMRTVPEKRIGGYSAFKGELVNASTGLISGLDITNYLPLLVI
jgi:hypothetical protein